MQILQDNEAHFVHMTFFIHSAKVIWSQRWAILAFQGASIGTYRMGACIISDLKWDNWGWWVYLLGHLIKSGVEIVDIHIIGQSWIVFSGI